MGKIRTIRESNLKGTSETNEKVYPVTSTEAVYIPKIGKLTPHIHPRIVLSEAQMNILIANGGPFEEGYDYAVYEDEE